MSQSLFSYTIWAIGLVLLQVLVGNHIHIFGIAMPMLYIYLLLILPNDTPHWVTLFVAFFVGIAVDVFSNTPGLTASSLLIVALLRPYILQAFAPKEKGDDALTPSTRTMEWGGFTRYAVTITLLHCIAFYSIEAFGLVHFTSLLLSIIGSTVLTTLLILGIEMLRHR